MIARNYVQHIEMMRYQRELWSKSKRDTIMMRLAGLVMRGGPVPAWWTELRARAKRLAKNVRACCRDWIDEPVQLEVDQANAERRTYRVPPKFWDDHRDRMPCDGDATDDMATELSRNCRGVLIEGTHKQIATLRADAEFYAGRWGPDMQPAGLKASARATLRALAS